MILRVLAPVILSSLAVILMSCQTTTSPDPRPLRVAVFQDGEQYREFAQDSIDVIEPLPDVTVEIVSGEAVRAGALAGVDVLVFPGGTGGGQCRALGPEGGAIVRDFAEAGGGVVGVCAGGYSLIRGEEDVFSNVELVNADLLDGEHWARGIGLVEVVPAAEGAAPFEMLYYNGPLWLPGSDDSLPDYAVLATFVGEMHEGDAPEGVMPGTPAVIAAPLGGGRVILFSAHPEKSPGHEWLLERAVRWAAQGVVAEREEVSWESVFRVGN
jgi:glutamine amidotransferase-like uncharacterized protein